MNYISNNRFDSATPVIVVFGVIILVLAVTLPIIREQRNMYKGLFYADKACRPGMVIELLDNNQALCVGGENEKWTVEIRR